MTKRIASAHQPKLALQRADRIVFHYLPVCYQPGPVRPTVYHALKHQTDLRNDIRAVLAQNTRYSTHVSIYPNFRSRKFLQAAGTRL
jgi:hypothetical protein